MSSDPKMEPSYRIEKVKGTGKGIVATRDIKVGELIIEESPLVIVFDSQVRQAIDKIPKENRCAFFELKDSHSPAKPTPETIYRTIALAMGDIPTGAALYRTICRMNHSCAPNTNHSWQEKTQTETIYASRDILKGEELTIYYFNVRQPHKDRQAMAMTKFRFQWRFQCKCTVCSQLDHAESDERKKRITVLDHAIARVTVFDPRAGYRLARERLRLLDKEEYPSPAEHARTHYDAFHASIGIADIKVARKHAGLAWAYRKLAEGPNSESTLMMWRYFERPAAHMMCGLLGLGKISSICDQCGRGHVDLWCGRCGFEGYCNEVCRTARGEMHKAVCDMLQEHKLNDISKDGTSSDEDDEETSDDDYY